MLSPLAVEPLAGVLSSLAVEPLAGALSSLAVELLAGMLSSLVVEPLAGVLSPDVVEVVRDASFSSIAAHSFLYSDTGMYMREHSVFLLHMCSLCSVFADVGLSHSLHQL